MTEDELKAIRRLQEWHASNMTMLGEMLEAEKPMTLKLGDKGEEHVLTEEQHKGLRIGLIVAREMFGELPIYLQGPNDDADETEEEL